MFIFISCTNFLPSFSTAALALARALAVAVAFINVSTECVGDRFEFNLFA